MSRYLKVTTEHLITHYHVYIAKSEETLNDMSGRERFRAETLEAAISLAFKLCYERFKVPPILNDGALEDVKVIQISYEGARDGDLLYGVIRAEWNELNN